MPCRRDTGIDDVDADDRPSESPEQLEEWAKGIIRQRDVEDMHKALLRMGLIIDTGFLKARAEDEEDREYLIEALLGELQAACGVERYRVYRKYRKAFWLTITGRMGGKRNGNSE